MKAQTARSPRGEDAAKPQIQMDYDHSQRVTFSACVSHLVYIFRQPPVPAAVAEEAHATQRVDAYQPNDRVVHVCFPLSRQRVEDFAEF